MGNHPRAAADVAFGDGSRLRGVERIDRIFRRHMKAVDVVQIAVIGFCDDRQGPEHVGFVRQTLVVLVFHLPCDDGVMHDTDRMRVGDHDGAFEKPGFSDPGRSRHLAVAIERMPARENRIVSPAARQYCCDASPGWSLAAHELPEPLMIVLCPTSTPATSVIAFSGPGVPSKGTPRSRADRLGGERGRGENRERDGERQQ